MKPLLICLLLVGVVGCEESEQDAAPSDTLVLPPTVDKTIVNGIGMKLTLNPAGTFMMGSPESEEARNNNEHQHEVTISKAFYMQTTEVTQGQWKELMDTEPWKG